MHWRDHKVLCKEIRKADVAARSAPKHIDNALFPAEFAPTLLLAEKGFAVAQYFVGGFYASGTGVAHSWPSAFTWWKRCAAQASPPLGVWVQLGVCYELGRGVAVDEVEAVRLYRIGAALGDAGAQFSLAQCLERGLGVPMPDRASAFKLYAAAAGQDDPGAISCLGLCYSRGIGVAQDVPRGVLLMERALSHPQCPRGIARDTSQSLGSIYWNGDAGVPRDRELAVRYWRQAASLGSETAVRQLREHGLT